MKTLKLYFTALFLITVVNFVNRARVRKRNGTLDGYDRKQAVALDVFAKNAYYSFWEELLTDGSKKAYKFNKTTDETLSSALGENILRGTQSKAGRPGMLASWFHGERLSGILNRAFREPAHCVDARKDYLKKLEKEEL